LQYEPKGHWSSNWQMRGLVERLSSKVLLVGQAGFVVVDVPPPSAALAFRHWPNAEQVNPGEHQVSSTQSATQFPPV
jgi:hypothetical protein